MTSLTVHDLHQMLGKKSILNGISLKASSGHISVLLGPNGAGKTTLLKTIMGLFPNQKVLKPNEKNAIKINNICVNQWSVSQRVEAGLIYLPQHTSLFQHMTVHDNLELVYEYQTCWRKQPHESFINERNQWLKDVKLEHSLLQQAGLLSGGQKRKLELVRSLLMHPKLIMLDEPFAGVDPKSIYELKTIFTNMAKNGVGIIISDHHVDQLISIGQTIYVIMDGKVVTSGDIEAILKDEHTKNSYLGTQFYNEVAKRYSSS